MSQSLWSRDLPIHAINHHHSEWWWQHIYWHDTHRRESTVPYVPCALSSLLSFLQLVPSLRWSATLSLSLSLSLLFPRHNTTRHISYFLLSMLAQEIEFLVLYLYIYIRQYIYIYIYIQYNDFQFRSIHTYTHVHIPTYIIYFYSIYILYLWVEFECESIQFIGPSVIHT